MQKGTIVDRSILNSLASMDTGIENFVELEETP